MPTWINRLSRTIMHACPFANGQGRIVDRTFLHRMRFAEETLTVTCAGGFELEVFPNDHIGRHIYITGQFDGSIVSVLRSFCKRGDERILDIGANIGSVSCALLHAMPDCRVVAVEPQPRVFALLEKNVARVGGGRGRALNVAIADRDGTGRMAIDTNNSGCSHLVENGAANAAAIEVELINGERLLEQSGLDRIDLIKIDVEGFEEPVLRALVGMIKSQRPRAVLFEHHGDLNQADAPIRRIFDGCGYHLLGIRKTLFSNKLIPIEQLARHGQHAHDYVAVPS